MEEAAGEAEEAAAPPGPNPPVRTVGPIGPNFGARARTHARVDARASRAAAAAASSDAKGLRAGAACTSTFFFASAAHPETRENRFQSGTGPR